MSQAGSDPWHYRSYAINEFQAWQTTYIVLPVDNAVDRMGLILAVAPGFDAGVSIRTVSFTDAAAAYASGAEKYYEGPARPERQPDDIQ